MDPKFTLPSPVGQSIGSLTAEPGLTSLIPTRSHTFMEIDHEMISIVMTCPDHNSTSTGTIGTCLLKSPAIAVDWYRG